MHAGDSQIPLKASEAAGNTAAKELPADEGNPVSSEFSSMKGIINYDIWKAITVRPFKHTTMSPVQEAVLRLLPDLAGPVNPPEDSEATPPKDLLVKARTGTGKTLAFLVPAIQARINELRTNAKGVPGVIPKAIAGQHRRDQSKHVAGTVILSPTRELATQIAAESDKLGTHIKDFETRLFVGGASKGEQIRAFKRGRKDVVVATPGRLLDLLSDDSTGVAKALAQVRTVIFDEADTLLDMGFKDEIDRILEYLPPKENRQTFLFSATVSRQIQHIAEKSLKPDHLFIDTVPKNEVNLHQHVPQYATVLPTPAQQIPHLVRLILHDALANPNGKAIVFLPTTKLTKLFAQLLISLKPLMLNPRNTTIYEIHSQLTQARRDRSSDKFRSAKYGYNILVTSDVSARGVDYPGVTRVIQLGKLKSHYGILRTFLLTWKCLGIPTSADSYVHRVGRTGRAGKEGRADLVLLPFEAPITGTALQKVPLQPLTVADAHAQLVTLAQQQGATQLEHRLENLDDLVLGQGLPALQEDEVEDAFFSMLGFYVAHANELSGRKPAIYEALKEWAVEAMGLADAPHVSPTMLSKLGLREKPQRKVR